MEAPTWAGFNPATGTIIGGNAPFREEMSPNTSRKPDSIPAAAAERDAILPSEYLTMSLSGMESSPNVKDILPSGSISGASALKSFSYMALSLASRPLTTSSIRRSFSCISGYSFSYIRFSRFSFFSSSVEISNEKQR